MRLPAPDVFGLLVTVVLLSGTVRAEHCSYRFPWFCDDGSCIPRIHYCDGNVDCADGSDEAPYNSSDLLGVECSVTKAVKGEKRRINRTCHLPSTNLCDKVVDCDRGVDECGACPWKFQCNNGDCVLRINFCDDKPGCDDGTDEAPFNGTGFQCSVTKSYQTKTCGLPDVHVCDGYSECAFGTDECFCGPNGEVLDETYSSDKCFRCLDGSLVIPSNHVCDGKVAHCQDMSDECLCRYQSNVTELCDNVCTGDDCSCTGNLYCIPNSGDKSKKVCIPREKVCDERYDCEDGMDEKFCPSDDEFFTCKDRLKKIKKRLVCDTVKDCEDGSDEDRCHETKMICFPYTDEYDNITDWRDPAQKPLPSASKYISNIKDWPFYAEECDLIPTCSDMADECDNEFCPTRPGFCDIKHSVIVQCEGSLNMITGLEVCDGLPTCNTTNPEKSQDEHGCPNRFYCENYGATRLPIHIPVANRCDGKQECDDVSDELGCPEETHYYCNDSGSLLFIRQEQKCDGRKDCAEGGDECENCDTSPFSSDQRLIKSRILIVFLWIFGIFATLGNISIIIYQTTTILKMKHDSSPVAARNRIMVLNLAIADFLVGIYLLALGIKDATTDKYCLEDQDWRSSNTCLGLGAMAVIGTEASVMMLIIMTGFRLYLVLRPHTYQNLNTVLFAIASAWVLAIIVGTAPFSSTARDYFLSCVWFRSHRYLGYACRADITEFTEKLIRFEGPDKRFSSIVGSEMTWDSMLEAQEALNPEYKPEKFFGFYSAHSVCLPRLFPDNSYDRSWSYSMLLLLFNFLGFVFIFVSYVVIYRTSTNTGVSTATSSDRAAVLQRKVTRIILSDFCCWMPICIMGFITFSGVDIGGVAYAVTAIILLPINSAMNPFLYSSLLDIIWDRLEPLRKRVRIRRTSKQAPGDPQTSSQRISTLATLSTKLTTSSSGRSPRPSRVDAPLYMEAPN